MRVTWCVAALAAACAAPKISTGDPAREIPAALARSASDWNRGDLDGFMSDYAKDSTVSYVTGGHVQYGWQPLYDHYKATYFAPGKSRDSLSFVDIRVQPLTMDLAFATARFELHRGDSTQGMVNTGLPSGERFDLLLEWASGGKPHHADMQGIDCAPPK